MNAPSAIETSNSVAEPTAIPSATTSTHSVKDLRHLLRKMLVGDEARRVGADEHSREQVPDDWRETKPVREVSVGKRRAQTAGQCQEEVEGVHSVMIWGFGRLGLRAVLGLP